MGILKDEKRVENCFYRRQGQYANWFDRHKYKCFKCKRDEQNKVCKYYIPVREFQVFEVKENI